MIPTPGVGVQVLSRNIRLCAFDGTQVEEISAPFCHISLNFHCTLYPRLLKMSQTCVSGVEQHPHSEGNLQLEKPQDLELLPEGNFTLFLLLQKQLVA